DVQDVVHEPFQRAQFALDNPLRHAATLSVDVLAEQQPSVITYVLYRMIQVVKQAGDHPPEHRLSFLSLHVLLELNEAVGHRVERGAELTKFVSRVDGDAAFELAFRKRLGAALQDENWRDEPAAEHESGANH